MQTSTEKIIRVLNNYAQGCDRRDWSLFEQVFVADVQARYGGYLLDSRDKVIGIIKNSLGGCGPTQHMLSNYYVYLDDSGDIAITSCYVRAAHMGIGEHEGVFYEVWGEYKDKLQCFDGEWRIIERKMVIYQEIGPRDVLKAE